jgi:hypothetical protein
VKHTTDITLASQKLEAGATITFADLEEISYNKDVQIYAYSAYQARCRKAFTYFEKDHLENETFEMDANGYRTTRTRPMRPRGPLPEIKTPKGREYTEVMTRAAGETLRPQSQVKDYIIVEIVVEPAKKPLPVVDPFDL